MKKKPILDEVVFILFLKDKQRSTKHTYKTKDRATRTPDKTAVNSGAPEG
jgi:uncharacterized membrane protein YsdA (DUF1294 family)